MPTIDERDTPKALAMAAVLCPATHSRASSATIPAVQARRTGGQVLSCSSVSYKAFTLLPELGMASGHESPPEFLDNVEVVHPQNGMVFQCCDQLG